MTDAEPTTGRRNWDYTRRRSHQLIQWPKGSVNPEYGAMADRYLVADDAAAFIEARTEIKQRHSSGRAQVEGRTRLPPGW